MRYKRSVHCTNSLNKNFNIFLLFNRTWISFYGLPWGDFTNAFIDILVHCFLLYVVHSWAWQSGKSLLFSKLFLKWQWVFGSPSWLYPSNYFSYFILIDWQFGMMECVVTNLVDEYPKYLRPRKELFIFLVCFVAFLFGFTIITQVFVWIIFSIK